MHIIPERLRQALNSDPNLELASDEQIAYDMMSFAYSLGAIAGLAAIAAWLLCYPQFAAAVCVGVIMGIVDFVIEEVARRRGYDTLLHSLDQLDDNMEGVITAIGVVKFVREFQALPNHRRFFDSVLTNIVFWPFSIKWILRKLKYLHSNR